MKIFYFMMVLFCNVSWGQKDKDNLKPPKLVLAEYDTIIAPHFKKMQPTTAKVYGIGVVDSLDLSEMKWNYESSEHALEKNGDLSLFVDTNDTAFHSHFYNRSGLKLLQIADYESVKKFSKKFDSKIRSYQVLAEKQIRIHHKSYPFFLFNNSKGKVIISKPIDHISDLFLLTEALDKNGERHPIEYLKQNSFLCGTGHVDHLLNPKTFLVGAVKRYSGDYKTKLRLKLSTEGSVLYSNEFEGEINYGQFSTTWLMYDLISKFAHGDNSLLDNRIKAAFLNN
ncbi:MAG: hypothetical protein AB8B59_18960 [Maribacter sp.]